MQDILIHTDAGITTITLNRVEKKNSFTQSMYATCADALDAARDDAAVRVVVFQGDATVFSAGNDIGDFLGAPPKTQDAPVFRFLRALAAFPKPIIAAVCGPAVGIGTTMLFHCDLVYAGDNAAFSMPFVNLGLCPEAASSLLVPQMMGYHRAAEALLMGEPFMAEAALEVCRRPGSGPQAGRQAHRLADRNQAPAQERADGASAGPHRRRSRQLRPHAG
jgi:enoyl-CoA hydratase/carnithine racemase